jgi:hypothetical protein
MTRDQIERTVAEAERFLWKAKELLELADYGGVFMGSKETGSLRRASLDLTRSLAEMRKP